MTFAVHHSKTRQLIIEIQNDKVTYIHPALSNPLKKIPTESCFSAHIAGEREKFFGSATEIGKDHPLYPKALRLYCETQMLTHPESFIAGPNQNPDVTAMDISDSED